MLVSKTGFTCLVYPGPLTLDSLPAHNKVTLQALRYLTAQNIQVWDNFSFGNLTKERKLHDVYSLIRRAYARFDLIKHLTILTLPNWEEDIHITYYRAYCERHNYPIQHLDPSLIHLPSHEQRLVEG